MDNKIEITEHNNRVMKTSSSNLAQETDYLKRLSYFEPKYISSCFDNKYLNTTIEEEYNDQHMGSDRIKDIRIGFITIIANIFLFSTPFFYGYIFKLQPDIMTGFIIVCITCFIINITCYLLLIFKKMDVVRKEKIRMLLMIIALIQFTNYQIIITYSTFQGRDISLARTLYLGSIIIYGSYFLLLKATIGFFTIVNLTISTNIIFIIIYQYFKYDNTSFIYELISNTLIYICYIFLKKLDILSRERFETSKKNEFLIDKYQSMIQCMGSLLVCLCENKIVYANNAYNTTCDSNFKENVSDKHMLLLTNLFPYSNNHDCKSLFTVISSIDNCDLTSQFTPKGVYKLNAPDKESCIILDVYVRNIELYNGTTITEVLLHDLSAMKKAEDEEKMSRMTKQIFSNIAHEFKTPLLTIVSQIEDLKEAIIENNNNSDLVDLGEKIVSMSNYTLFLIDDIIFYCGSFDEKNKIKMHVEYIRIKKIISFLESILISLLKSKNKLNTVLPIIEYDSNIDLDNILVEADETRLKQIFLNFVSNAVKFTKKGSIILSISINFKSELEIKISDTGKGISAENLHKILNSNSSERNLFENLDRKDNQMGTGLGLNIAFLFCNKLNYGIIATSEENKGTTFGISINNWKYLLSHSKQNSTFLNLPLRQQSINKSNTNTITKNTCLYQTKSSKFLTSTNFNHNMKLFSERKQSIYSNDSSHNTLIYSPKTINLSYSKLSCKDAIERRQILVVDDCYSIRKPLVKQLLSIIDLSLYEIIEYDDGIDIINHFINESKIGLNKVDFIFTDENMIYLNGSDAIRLLRNLIFSERISKNQTLKIVSTTGFDDINQIEAIKQSGVDYILHKPVKKKELLEVFQS